MTSILISIIILLSAAVLTLAFYAYRGSLKHKTSVKEESVGICKSAIETASQKEERKQRIVVLFEGRAELSNAEICKALGVSSRTAVRYLDELEREGKVEQVGKIGHAVTYRLK